MPLPNLSGKSFISTSPTFDSYQSGADSYREKVREKIQNSPRRNNNNTNSYEYSRSIDLSLNRDNSFRPVSRHSSVNNNNNNNNGENSNVRLKSAVSDNNNNYSRLKSGRRQIVIYNNNNNGNNNGNKNGNEDPEFTDNSNIDMRKEMHRRNNTRNRNFNTSPIVSDEDFSLNTDRTEGGGSSIISRHQRSQRVEDNFFENSNDNIVKHQQPILSNQTKENLLKAPLITPRKSLQQSNNNSKSNLFMNKTSNDTLDEFSSTSNKRYNNKNSENNENEFIPNSFEQNKLNKLRSPRNFDMVTSRTSFRDDDDDNQTSPPQTSSSQPPVPVPRKRDPNANLLNNNFNNHMNTNLNSEKAEIRIKRNSSASISKYI